MLHRPKRLRQRLRLGLPSADVGSSHVGQLLRVIWPFLLIIVLLVGLAWGCLVLVSAGRAYVSGESNWSKGQKDAVQHLMRYSASCAERDFAQFEEAIAVPLGDREARLALEQPEPDIEAARRGFLQGGNHPDDIDGLVMLFLRFGNVPFMRRAIDTWTEGDVLIGELVATAAALRADTASTCALSPGRGASLARIDAINARLTPLEQRFSATVGDANRMVQHLLLIAMGLSAASLASAGVVLSHRIVRRGAASERAHAAEQRDLLAHLHAARERAQVTLTSIAEGVITADAAGRVDTMNPAAEALTGWPAAEAIGRQVREVLRLVDEQTGDALPLPSPREGGSGSEAGRGANAPATLLRRSGDRLAIDASISAIRGPDAAVVGLALVLRDVSAERRRAAVLSHEASHDSLTGLVNRREFERRLANVLGLSRAGERHCVLYLDLDQFKVVNDGCGHAAGDALLMRLGQIMKTHLRDRDTLARMGGDEFCLILEHCDAAAACKIAEALRQAVAEFVFFDSGRTFRVGTSIGVVETPDASIGPGELLSAADAACRIAKERGRNRIQLYRWHDEEISTRRRETSWFSRIQEALAEDRFVLWAQEIVDLKAAQRHGDHLEILVRMLDEQGEPVPPGLFIPAAERFGLMTAVDRWVIEQAFGTMARWRRTADPRLPRICAINVSGASMADEGFPLFLHDAFVRHGIPYAMVCLEITETSAVSNLARACGVIQEFRALGCRFALDDFGSGMSSFAYLKSLPVDYVKLDGDFVRQVAHSAVERAIVEAIHRMAQALGMRTVAEYVEDDAIRQVLLEIGVDFGQGFGLARPRLFDGGA